jgi:hypothetical protein
VTSSAVQLYWPKNCAQNSQYKKQQCELQKLLPQKKQFIKLLNDEDFFHFYFQNVDLLTSIHQSQWTRCSFIFKYYIFCIGFALFACWFNTLVLCCHQISLLTYTSTRKVNIEFGGSSKA